MTTLDRRSFLQAGGVTAGAALLSSTGLQAISMRMAEAVPGKAKDRGRNVSADYGPISPKVAVNTRPLLAQGRGQHATVARAARGL